MVKGTYILVFNLHLNGLNAPFKRHRLAEWIQEQEPKSESGMDLHILPNVK